MTSRSPLENYLPELEELVERVSREEAPALIGDLERLKARAWARLTQSQKSSNPPKARHEPDRLISAEEAAEILGVKRRWVYAHAERIPGYQRLSRRCLRFSEQKLRRWMATRTT